MPAELRFSFRLARLALFALALSSFPSQPLLAQVQGVPAMEFHGVPPSGIGAASSAHSVFRSNSNASGGAAAFGCCAGFFFPSSFTPLVPYPSRATPHREHRRHHRDRDEFSGASGPVYVPYAVPYAADDTADDQDEVGAVTSLAGNEEVGRPSSSPAGRAERRQFNANGTAEEPEQRSDSNFAYDRRADSATETSAEAPPDPPEPVVAQPATVLVFKDGHRLEVVNYAIVGETLFDFSADRTHKILISDLDIGATQKANEASGVEFKLPPGEAASTLGSSAN